MKDIFSFSSTFPKLSGVHFGCDILNMLGKSQVKSIILLSTVCLQHIVSKGRLGYNWVQNYSSILGENLALALKPGNTELSTI